MAYDLTAVPDRERVSEPPADAAGLEALTWLLDDFVKMTPGVLYAQVATRDGLKALASGMPRDWADSMAAVVSGLSSLARGFTGPTGKKGGVKQHIIERDDCYLFITGAGTGTVLGVIARPEATAQTVAYEMTMLVKRFAPHMSVLARRDTPARQDPGPGSE
ncbi:Roadblock/LC7 family protein [Actinobacteria bacterium OK074]|nr:Roadblock/LC7 family protein [Actinobacteria bacterium OK074]